MSSNIEPKQQLRVETGASSSTLLTIVTTNKVRAKLARALGVTGRLPIVTHMAFGTGGVTADNVPIAPTPDMNALRREVFRIPVSEVTFPVPTTVQFLAELSLPAHNGHELSELAIVDEDGDLVGIQSFSIITKQDRVTLKFYWICEF